MAGRKLIVEGVDDLHVLSALLQAHHFPETFKIEKSNGVTQLLDAIPVRLKLRNEERLGVVLDADEDIEARWMAIRDRVHRVYPDALPKRPDPAGTLVELDDDIRFGVWVMPDNELPGILEDFIAFLVPSSDDLWPLVTAFIEEGIPPERRRFPAVRKPKSLIHAWLALQEEPGKPLGQAITSRYLVAEASVADPLLAWLRRLFLES